MERAAAEERLRLNAGEAKRSWWPREGTEKQQLLLLIRCSDSWAAAACSHNDSQRGRHTQARQRRSSQLKPAELRLRLTVAT